MKQPRVGFAILIIWSIATIGLAYEKNIEFQRGVQWYVDRGINPEMLDFHWYYPFEGGPLVLYLAFTTLACWLISIVWVIAARKERFRRQRKLLGILLLTALMITSQLVSVGSATSDTQVDVLVAGDEEVSAQSRDYIEREVLAWLQGKFLGELEIHIHWCLWTEWDSDDGTTSAYELLQEAIHEIGGTWVTDIYWPGHGYWRFNRGMTWYGVVVDMLVVWTGQDMTSQGLGVREWGACIVQDHHVFPERNEKEVTMHEMSHLYGLTHCSEWWCVMTTTSFLAADWQSNCHSLLMNHKDDFTRQSLSIEGATGGFTDPVAGTYFHYHGTEVMVNTLPWGGYEFRYWRLDGENIYTQEPEITVTMDSPHVLQPVFEFVGTPSGDGGGSGCPYVSVWNGMGYVLDNNLLPNSKLGNGSDVEDYYRLEQPLAPCQGVHRLLISEFESEHSYIDQVKLLAIDHASDVNIAVAPDGEILTYRNPTPPISAVDDNGTDRLDQIRYMDGNLSDPSTYFQGNASDYLLLNFDQIWSDSAKLIVRNDMLCMDKCINVQVRDINGQWQNVDVIASRAFWAVEGVNLSPYLVEGQDLLVRLIWTQPHKLDYVGLDTTRQEDYVLHTANLVSATHSTIGDVRPLLKRSDNLHAELVPGQQIELQFTLPNNTDEARTYIFCTEGHYTITTPNP